MPSPVLRQVSASAGSGKTFDLTRRFLEHLASMPQRPYQSGCAFGQDRATAWGDILAATFTNSAAAEMKERLLRRLKESALGLVHDAPVQAAQAALWVDTIVRQYGALNIRTLDSLLHLIVRTAALDLGLPPDFTPAFTTAETLTPLLDDCLERAWQGDERLHALLRAVCESLIYQSEVEGYQVGKHIRRRLLPVLEAQFKGFCGELATVEDLEERRSRLERDCVTSASRLLDAVAREGLILDKRARNAFEKVRESELTTKSAYLHKASLQECLTSKSPAPFAVAGKIRPSLVPESLDKYTAPPVTPVTANAAYIALSTAYTAYMEQGEILRRAVALAPFVALAEEISTGLDALLQREGLLPAQILPQLAQQTLEAENGVPTALCRLASGLRHILIDEFQDTSREQWEALTPLVKEALACGGSLTLLGDVKQAIYAWRGGEAELFDEVFEDKDLCAIAPTPERYTLDTNWRSRVHIVATNNALFAPLKDVAVAQEALTPLMGRDCPEHILRATAHNIAQSFANVVQKHKKDTDADSDLNKGYVTLHRIKAENSAAMNDAVREALRERLLADVGLRRPWGDVCILTRSNDQCGTVASWLMEWGVPVITENSLLLGEHPLILQSLAFLRFLDAPHDDLALWQVLTGSLFAPVAALCGADADALCSIATAREGSLYADVLKHFPDVGRYLTPFVRRADIMSPYDSVREWHRLLQVDERFADARTFVRRFFEIVHTVAERGHATLGEFLDYWRRNGGDEKAPMPDQTDAVRVMTIHKAKGLEFPVVIVPWTSFNFKNDAALVPYTLDDMHLLAPRCKEMGDMYYEAQAVEARETLHLAYVALTRAEEELHVFHTIYDTMKGRNLAFALDVLFEAANISLPFFTAGEPTVTTPAIPGCTPVTVGEAALGFIEEQGEPVSPREVAKTYNRLLKKLRGSKTPPSLSPLPPIPETTWRPMHWLPRLQIYRHPLKELGFTSTRRGLLMHHCLECLRWTGEPEADAQRAVREGLRTFVLPVAPATDVAHVGVELEAALAWFAALPDARDWLERGLPEHALMDAHGNIHRVDLLVPPIQGTDSTAWIAIEYKSGLPDDAHTVQLRRYLALLDALPDASAQAARGILIYLDQRICHTI